MVTKLVAIFYFLTWLFMWYIKNLAFDLGDTMSDEEMIEYWFELSKQESI